VDKEWEGTKSMRQYCRHLLLYRLHYYYSLVDHEPIRRCCHRRSWKRKRAELGSHL